MRKYIYLAGHIEACKNDNEINDWRNDISDLMLRISNGNLVGVNPYRIIERKATYDSSVHKQIIDKNFYDCEKCDAILAYLPTAFNKRRPSYGTIFEIAWFAYMRKPIFIITSDEILLNHPVIKSHTGWIFSEYTTAAVICQEINSLMEPYYV